MTTSHRARKLLSVRVLPLLIASTVALGLPAALLGAHPGAGAEPVVTVTAVSDTHVTATGVGSSVRAVAGLVTSTPSDAVLVAGDLTDTGRASDFAAFDGLFGAVKAKMRPAPGNHDYEGTDGSAYFAYFAGAAGSVSVPWYSFDLGAWHVVSLVAAPDPGSPNYWSASAPQLQWLSADLDAHPSQPVLALFHAARWSGAEHGDNPDLAAIWNVLAAHHVELAINGHDHVYQRFAPQDAAGQPASDGVREIMVSTGGAGHNVMSSYTGGHNLQAWNNTNYGVTTLTLGATSYSWKFTASDGSAWTDSGTSPVNPQHTGGGNPPPVAASVHVTSLTDSSQLIRRNQWQPAVTVAVADEAGRPLSAVVVTVRTSGLTSRTLTCTTGTTGTCRAAASTVNRHGSVTFTVTDLGAPSRSYRPADSLVTSLTVAH